MTRKPERVLVVGGGLAGITAALALADHGVYVELLEARARLGGAASSYRRNGLMVDNGQHVFLRCCSEYQRLLDRIGAAGKVVIQRRLSIRVLRPGGVQGTLYRDWLPVPLHLARALALYCHIPARERLSAARAVLAIRRLDLRDPMVDGRSLKEWLTERGQSVAAIEGLWELIGRATLNATADQASLALAAKVFSTGLLSAPDAADIGYARVPLGEIHDDAASAALAEAGVRVRRRARVTALALGDGSVEVTCAGGGTAGGDALVLAVPHDAAVKLVPAAAVVDLRRFLRLGASPIVNVHLLYDRPVTELEFAAGVGTPVQWIFDRTAAAGCGGQYLVVSLSAADDMVDWRVADFQRVFPHAVSELLPAAGQARLVDFFVTKERAATFLPAPGTGALRPGPRTNSPRVFLAGAWTDTGWPATMESAVRSGRAAAEALLMGR
ncbi:hydroxysqualene dehydroxylase HpnE [Nonomuraea sp. NPDC005650]|uniref:hydroxysqualene dehydroxylase HpnE n=1 Tax=Nonomuraea sp. NPDC005650 TaxID=3157045 RepID=UPI0033B213ED